MKKPIISQETYNKFTIDERKQLADYFDDNKDSLHAHIVMSDLFGKRDFRSGLKEIKTYNDIIKYYPAKISGIIGLESEFKDDVVDITDNVAKKLIAAAKIAKLIDIGYGGMITDEEWCDPKMDKWCVHLVALPGKKYKFDFKIHNTTKHFIAFNTCEQLEKFMSYSENRNLIKEYFMCLDYTESENHYKI